MNVTAYDIAQRFIGMKEVSGKVHNPQIVAMLQLDVSWPTADEVAWCSAFANYVAWLLRLPRSKSLRARSWLLIGVPISIDDAVPGYDVVIFKRGAVRPGPEVIGAPGHVAFFAGREPGFVHALGGNQHDQVQVSRYNEADLLGVRRLHDPEPPFLSLPRT